MNSAEKINNHSAAYYVRKEFGIKKIILIIILIACLVFIFTQKDSFLIGKSYFNDLKGDLLTSEELSAIKDDPTVAKSDYERYQAKVPSDKRLSLKGSQTVTQTFTARDSKLNKIKLFFHNPSSYTAKGTIYVKVLDKNGKSIGSSQLDVSMVANDSITRFDFNGNTEKLNANGIVSKNTVSAADKKGVDISKGSKYTLKITTKNVSSDSAFGIFIGDNKYSNDSVLTVNGKNMGGERLFCSIQYLHFNKFIFVLFSAMILASIIFILLPMQYLSELYEKSRRRRGKKDLDLNKLIIRILFIMSPFVSFYLLCKIAGMRTTETARMVFSLNGFLNALVIGFVWWFFYTVSNRTKGTAILTVALTFLFGFINYMLIQFRDCPLIATDFSSIGTAKDVAASYTLIFGKACIWAIAITVIFCCVTGSLKSYKGLPLKKRLAVLIIMCVWGGGSYALLTNNAFLSNNSIYVSGFNPKASYKHHGYAVSFVLTLNSSRTKKPKDYSVANVESITKNYTSDKAGTITSTTSKSPYVIVIMNEAFSDLHAVGDFKTSTDYMPFYHSLKKNTVKGTLHSSVFGGGTADTEFEFLTGDSMYFLPFKSIPYNNRIKTKSPSFTQNLKAEGYGGNIAFHPGMATSYNRAKAYPKLGFSKFISLDDLKDPEYLRSYVSDKEDFSQIIKQYNKYKSGTTSSAPFYMFNVTIQNHSGYKLTDGVVEKEVTITNDDVREEQAEQYLNLIKKTDEALETLITYFQSVDQPTVIVMYGDHQPRVGDSFYNSLYGKSSNKLTLEETEKKYQVPVMIWANYNIKEKDNLDISANYLGSYLAKMTGQKLTGYNKYLLDLEKKVPVITAICYKGDNGKTYDVGEKSKYTKYIDQYEMIQYNELIDYKNRVSNFYYLK